MPEPTPRERALAHRERLFTCALQLLHDVGAAQEVVLRGLQQALRSPFLLELAPDEAALSRWLDRLVIHLCLARLKAAGLPPLPPATDEAARGAGGGRQDTAHLDNLVQALARLSPEAQVTVTLVVVQGRGLAEAAELLGCSEQSCRFWLNHGRKHIRRTLQPLLSGEASASGPQPTVPLTGPHDLRRGKKTAAQA